jgi:Ca-activated chloride channel family protein
MFGLLLRHSKYASYASFNEVEKIAKASLNNNDYLQTEFIELVDKVKKIYSKKNKKKNVLN